LLSQARYSAHDFVAKDEGKFRIWQFAVHDVQIGTAHGAGQHLELNLAAHGFRRRAIAKRKRLARLIENHRAHGFIFAHPGPVAQTSVCGFLFGFPGRARQPRSDGNPQTEVFGLMTSFTQRSQDILYTRLGR